MAGIINYSSTKRSCYILVSKQYRCCLCDKTLVHILQWKVIYAICYAVKRLIWLQDHGCNYRFCNTILEERDLGFWTGFTVNVAPLL